MIKVKEDLKLSRVVLNTSNFYGNIEMHLTVEEAEALAQQLLSAAQDVRTLNEEIEEGTLEFHPGDDRTVW